MKKMKRYFMPLAAAVLCVLGLGSCRVFRFSSDLAEREVVTAEGESVTRAFDSLPEFRAVEFSVPADISYSAGECALSVTTAQNVLDKLDVRVDGDVLVVELKPGVARLKNVKTFDVVLSSPELRSVGIDGAASFKAGTGVLSSEDFYIEVNGAGDISLASLRAADVGIEINGAGNVTVAGVDCTDIDIEINGASSCTVSGKAESAAAEINGAGDIDLSGLDTRELDSSVNGIGSIKRPKGLSR